MGRNSVFIYLVKRIGIYVLTIWGSFTVAFVFFHSVPGDPIAAYVQSMEQRYSYRVPDAEKVIEEYRKMMGLDGSIFHQYVQYLKNVFLRFDLGPSFMAFPTPASVYIMQALPWTIGLLGVATLVSWVLGFVFGGLIGWKRDALGSRLVTNLSLVLSRIPNYFMALALLFIFAYGLLWLPRRGAYDPAVTKELSWPFIQSVIRHATLPALSLVIISVSGWLLSTRSLVVTILGEDYLLYAKAKGLKDRRVLNKYVLRNAMLPQVTGLAMSLGFILSGAFLVEWVFVYPGMGTLFLNSISMLDYNTVQGIMLMSITLVLTATLFIDLFLPLVDPRVASKGET
jgi:peptide/nickel transport system permease protein